MEGLQTVPREDALAFVVANLEAGLSAVDGRSQSLMSMNFVFNAQHTSMHFIFKFSLHTSHKHAVTDHLVRTSTKVALFAECFGRRIGGYESVIAYWSMLFCRLLNAIYVHNNDSQKPI